MKNNILLAALSILFTLSASAFSGASASFAPLKNIVITGHADHVFYWDIPLSVEQTVYSVPLPQGASLKELAITAMGNEGEQLEVLSITINDRDISLEQAETLDSHIVFNNLQQWIDPTLQDELNSAPGRLSISAKTTDSQTLMSLNIVGNDIASNEPKVILASASGCDCRKSKDRNGTRYTIYFSGRKVDSYVVTASRENKYPNGACGLLKGRNPYSCSGRQQASPGRNSIDYWLFSDNTPPARYGRRRPRNNYSYDSPSRKRYRRTALPDLYEQPRRHTRPARKRSRRRRRRTVLPNLYDTQPLKRKYRRKKRLRLYKRPSNSSPRRVKKRPIRRNKARVKKRKYSRKKTTRARPALPQASSPQRTAPSIKKKKGLIIQVNPQYKGLKKPD